jgi:beta-N-acetylhexosaminidase
VVSDDLEMKAVRTGWGIATSASEAIAAGCDTLLVCSELAALDEAHAALVGRAADDDAFAERLADAAARTLAVRRAHPPRGSIDGAERVRELAAREGATIEAEIAERHAQVTSSE